MSSVLQTRITEALRAAKPAVLQIFGNAVQWVTENKIPTCWGAVAAALLYLNAKRFPLVWHVRVFYHIWWPKKRHFESKPGSIFRPVVTPSRVALLETDYNLHKSNSTYFSDLDVARTDLLAAIRSEAIRGGLYKEYKNGVMVLLAGTSCTFKKEIKPGVAFDMHSRILTWDRKWIYVVTHFAERRKGAASFTYEPRRKEKAGGSPSRSPVVYATAISKCVVKAGRLTVPPEKFFRAAGVLAPESPEKSGADTKAAGESGSEGSDEWTWDRVEEERVRALSMADGFANGLDAAHEEFHALG